MEGESSSTTQDKLVLSPYLGLENGLDFSEFAKKVFNAQDKKRKLSPDGKLVMHGIVNISGVDVMYSHATEDKGYMNSSLMVYVNDCDEPYKKALAEGATSIIEPADHEFGRSGGIKDPFGTTWWIAVAKKTEKSDTSASSENKINLPENYQGVMPYFKLKDAQKFSDFVQKVFNAKELKNKKGGDGTTIMHAEVSIGGYTVMFSEGSSEGGYKPGALGITSDNVGEYYKKALEAGATSTMELAEYPWGKFCGFKDTCGNTWWLNSPPKSAGK